MRRSGYQQRLATHFIQPRLTTADGTIFVAPRPVDLESYFGGDGHVADDVDPTLSVFERLLESAQYQLVLSLTWGPLAASQTLDLGLLRTSSNQLFVVHQVNDDVGTSLIVGYLSASAPLMLLAPFLIDYLSSRGSAYMVNLPGLLPQGIWIARPELVSHATVATGLLGLVTPGAPAGLDAWGGVASLGDHHRQGGVSLVM
jgi:hypothetical protein